MCNLEFGRIVALVALLMLGSAPVGAVPPIQHWQTGNGARVYFVPTPQLPIVDVRVVLDAAASRDGDKPGLAVLTNGLLAEGAGDLSADTIAERLDAVGADLSNDALRDMAIVSLRSLSEPAMLRPALETLALVLGRPTFPQDAFERERARMLVALEQQKQSPDDIAEKAFYAALYDTHPYASPVLGTEAAVKALTADDVRAFYRRLYVGRNAVVALVGDLTREQAQAVAEQVVGGLPAGEPPPPLPEPQPVAESERVTLHHPSTQTHLLVGQLGMVRDDPDYFPLYVGNHVLGGSGLVSLIADEVREKRGLAYSSSSHFSPMRSKGPFVMGLQTRNETADEALAVLNDTLARFVHEGPLPEQLQRAKRNITGGFALEVDSNSEMVGYLAMIGFYAMPLDFLETFIPKVEAVTAEQVREVFARRIQPERQVVVMVGGKG